MKGQPEVSIVVPVYNEGIEVIDQLVKISDSVQSSKEILVVVDSKTDESIKHIEAANKLSSDIKLKISEFPAGPANAIRFGFSVANARVCVVTMADGCDDPRQIDDLVRLINRGVVVAAASRYMPGGQQVGGPRVKRFLSKLAGQLLYTFAGVGTRDATNSFKAYSKEFLDYIEPESKHGFELGLELTSKARRLRLPIAEIPTTWIDRQFGKSNFKLIQWLPKYFRWFLYAFGRKITKED